jgi:hypothetical protein
MAWSNSLSCATAGDAISPEIKKYLDALPKRKKGSGVFSHPSTPKRLPTPFSFLSLSAGSSEDGSLRGSRLSQRSSVSGLTKMVVGSFTIALAPSACIPDYLPV